LFLAEAKFQAELTKRFPEGLGRRSWHAASLSGCCLEIHGLKCPIDKGRVLDPLWRGGETVARAEQPTAGIR
jgi:hypothetical protein